MRQLILQAGSSWKAERPDRDAPRSIVLRESDLVEQSPFASGIRSLFDQLEKRQSERHIPTMPAQIETPTALESLDPSLVRQCIAGLLEIQAEASRLIDRLSQLEGVAR